MNRRINSDANTSIPDYRTNDSLSSNINNTQNVKDLKEILGPLPKVPESLNENWVRRQSRVSGIYEEIEESRSKEANTSRVSIVSGLYEDMHFDNEVKTDHNTSKNSIEKRKRVNTNEFGVNRSNTNTEADIKKKFSWTLHNVVSGLTKRFDGPRKGAKSTLEDFDTKERKVSIRRQFKTTFQKSNRNSFSTPDLSHLPDTFVNCHRGGTTESHNLSIDFLNISFESISNGYSLDEFNDLTITNRYVKSNILCANSSSVNLLTASDCSTSSHEGHTENEPIYQVPKNIPLRLIDETTGYCIMGPLLKQERNLEAFQNKLDSKDFGDKNDSSSHYLKMDEVRVELRKKPQEEPIYANIERKNTLLRYSIEEKIPSYFPNEDFYQKPKKHRHIKTSTNEKPWNIYTPSPKKYNNSSNTIKKQELNKSYENAMLNQIQPNLTQYGTLPHQLDKRAKNHFGSLPRFKKIDFSPLRIKLNNMFLRYNNSQV